MVCDDLGDGIITSLEHPHSEEDFADYYDHGYFVDDVSGQPLDREGVIEARKVELEFVDSRPVYREVPLDMCWSRTGKPPLGTKWVDVDKGGPGAHAYRSRWVAKQFRDDKCDDFFAATPPYETMKLLVSLAASQGLHRPGWRRKRDPMLLGATACRRGLDRSWVEEARYSEPLKLDLIDISRAHFNGEPLEETYVELPPERRRPGVCGKLVTNMYGTRGAAAAWEKNYSENLEAWGFERGIACPCLFIHVERNLALMVHGDDFLSLGCDKDLDWFQEQIGSVYEFKHVGRIGPEEKDEKAMRVLNRVITWGSESIEVEADQRHAEIVVGMLGLEKAKGLGSPGDKDTRDMDDEALDPELITPFRAMAARINFLSQDRPELLYPGKEVCRAMASPTVGAWQKLKKIGRFLKQFPRVVQTFKYQDMPGRLDVYVDSDWAGCRRSRTSTSGGCIRLGNHVLRCWSSTQAVIALSSGEAEYYAMLKGASLGLGVRSMAGDIGIPLGVKLVTDSSAAKGIAKRRGLGKVRHLDVCHLWLQEKVAKGELQVGAVAGKQNPADLMTKYHSHTDMVNHWGRLAHEARAGRHEKMPLVG